MNQAEYTKQHLSKTLLSTINKMEAEIERLKLKLERVAG